MAVTANLSDWPVRCQQTDNTFGPTIIESCRGGFDFTLLFEQAFLSLVPSVLLLLIVPFRLVHLSRSDVKTLSSNKHAMKLVVTIIIGTFQLTTLALRCLNATFKTRISIVSATFSVVDVVAILLLSHYEHFRSVRPSTILCLYLFFSSAFEAVQARTLWLALGVHPLPSIATSVIVLKLILLFLECYNKTAILKRPDLWTSPEATSNVFSRSVFWWLNPLFRLGFQNKLTLDQIFTLKNDLKSEALNRKTVEAWGNVEHQTKYALVITLWASLKWKLLLPVPSRLCLIAFNYTQPFIITRAINFVTQPESSRTKNYGYGLIGATAITYIGISISTGQYNYHLYRANSLVRGSLVSTIYHKTLQIDASTAKKTAALTLMSTDVDRIALTLEKVHEIWASTLEVLIAVYLLERQFGWSCVAPIIIAFICTFSNTWIAKMMPTRLKAWNQSIQKRVSITSTVLSDIKSLKMMNYTETVLQNVHMARIVELKSSTTFRKFIASMNTISSLPKNLSAPFAFMIFVLSTPAESLTATRAFTALAIIELLTNPLNKVLTSIPSFTAAMGCIERIQTYALTENWVDGRVSTQNSTHPNLVSTISAAVGEIDRERINSPSPSILGQYIRATENNVLDIRSASFAHTADSLPVIHNIDLKCSVGSLTIITGPIGCGKTSLLKAILGEMFIKSGEILVRSRRSAYCQQTPWLPNATFRSIIVGPADYDTRWYNKVVWSCALDQDISQFPDGGQSLIGSRGITLSGGQKQRLALARSLYTRAPFFVLDDVLSALDSKTEALVVDRLFGRDGLLKALKATVVLVTHAVHNLPLADKVIVMENGSFSQNGKLETLNCEEGFLQDLFVQDQSSEEKGELFPELPIAEEVLSRKGLSNKKTTTIDKPMKSGEISTYSFYFKSIGEWRSVVFLLTVMLLVFCTRFSQIWLQWWTESDGKHNGIFLSVYFIFSVGAILSYALSFWWMMIIILPHSGAKLHRQLLNSVLHAPLSFFGSTDSGTILNKFSQDLGFVSGVLPICVMQSSTTGLMCIAQILLIAISSTYFASIIPVVILIIWCIQKVYLRTSSQLRILDLEQKSPLYTHLTETIEGLVTIRAFGWQEDFENDNHRRLDNSQKPAYLLYCVQRWLQFVLDVVVAALAIILMTLITQVRSSTTGPALGVALINILGFSQSLAQFISFYTDLETSLGAVARIKSYVEGIKPEDLPLESLKPADTWPKRGILKLEHVTASYGNDSRKDIVDVNLDIKAGKKVGICGRTGSGKSSLMLTLCRLLEIESGAIFIDELDISRVPRNIVRSKINIVPQDPFFLPGTVRYNAHPMVSIPDVSIIDALEKVGLWTIISERGGLNADMSSISLSHGQHQMFCLARALLKRSPILVLDEATSKIDRATDDRIQEIIREEFKQHTVITIAHRLSTMMHCDEVVVMDKGRIVELGNPSELLEKKGLFWQLRQVRK